jgi:hypothetical protein
MMRPDTATALASPATLVRLVMVNVRKAFGRRSPVELLWAHGADLNHVPAHARGLASMSPPVRTFVATFSFLGCASTAPRGWRKSDHLQTSQGQTSPPRPLQPFRNAHMSLRLQDRHPHGSHSGNDSPPAVSTRGDASGYPVWLRGEDLNLRRHAGDDLSLISSHFMAIKATAGRSRSRQYVLVLP